jgi:hypothetical protein
MSGGREERRRSLRARRALDLCLYAGSATGVLLTVFVVVGFAAGGGWVAVKRLLFLAGFGLFGIAAFQLRPPPAHKRDRGAADDGAAGASGGREATPFERAVDRFRPRGGDALAPEDRVRPTLKLLAASLLTLGISFVMEVGFGVGP